MLFDLRARGRRRTIKVIYMFLAVLMGGGLIFFGIGGATSGGLLDAFKSNAGKQSSSDIFAKRVQAAERGVRLHPTDAAAWAALTRVRYQQAGSGDGYDQNQNVFTDKGKAELSSAEQAWDKYLTLTKKPDDSVASLMVQAFSEVGLNKPDKAVEAQEIIVDSREPTGPLYVQLAALAYQAGQTRKAELASKKAIALTPKDDREQIKAQLESVRAAASAAVSSATPASTSTPSS
jgi:hypothetical protein